MSLADSIIAATALLHRLPLVTRNEGDFTRVAGLEIIDPFPRAAKVHDESNSVLARNQVSF